MTKSRLQLMLVSIAALGWVGFQWHVWNVSDDDEVANLIISADDAGMCSAVDEAIIKVLEFGLVKSAGIMTVCPAFEEFAAYAASHPAYDYGVHLVLTAENPEFTWRPLLGASVPSLVRADGTFWRKSEEVAEHADADDVARELEAQVRRAIDRGIRISHLDHHMWVLLQRPDLLEIFVGLGIEFQLPLRIHREFVAKECGGALQDPAEYHRLIQPLANRGDRLLDFIETTNYDVPPPEKRRYFMEALRNLPVGMSEIVIHCSVNRPGLQLPNGVDRREADLEVFTSSETQSEIRNLGIRVIGWRDLARFRNKVP